MRISADGGFPPAGLRPRAFGLVGLDPRHSGEDGSGNQEADHDTGHQHEHGAFLRVVGRAFPRKVNTVLTAAPASRPRPAHPAGPRSLALDRDGLILEELHEIGSRTATCLPHNWRS